MKATAVAPANIAFIKYWGKKDDNLRLPLNSSLSMNMSAAFTTTTVEFSNKYQHDDISLLDGTLSDKEIQRVIKALDRIREHGGTGLFAKVMTKNTFPKGAGSAASASGFAALTVSAFAALGVELSEKELTVFARMGSGSACRSIPDGFVVWEEGIDSDSSYAYSLYPYTYWNLCDVLVIVDIGMKKVPTTEGMEAVKTSPLWKERVDGIPKKMEQMKTMLAKKDFLKLGTMIEEECLSMHAVMQTQTPSLYYWNEATKKLMSSVKEWRNEGISVYFTIDAGPNVHLICEQPTVVRIKKKLDEIEEVKNVIINTSAPGAHCITTHLF